MCRACSGGPRSGGNFTASKVPDYQGTAGLPPHWQDQLRDLKSAARVPYAIVRALKEFCLQDAWSRFRQAVPST